MTEIPHLEALLAAHRERRDDPATGRRLVWTGADLTGADLTASELTAAILRAADLRGADLTGADPDAEPGGNDHE